MRPANVLIPRLQRGPVFGRCGRGHRSPPCTQGSSQPPSLGLFWREAREGARQRRNVAKEHLEAILPSVVLSAQLSRQQPCQAAGSIPACHTRPPCQAWGITPRGCEWVFGGCALLPAKLPAGAAVIGQPAGSRERTRVPGIWLPGGCRQGQLSSPGSPAWVPAWVPLTGGQHGHEDSFWGASGEQGLAGGGQRQWHTKGWCCPLGAVAPQNLPPLLLLLGPGNTRPRDLAVW